MTTTTTAEVGKVEQIKNLRETKREMAADTKRQKAAASAATSAMESGASDDEVQRAAAQAAALELENQSAVEQVPQPGSILSPVDGAKVLDMAKKAAGKAPAKKVAPKPAAKKAPAKAAPAKAAAKKTAPKTTGTRVAPVAKDARVLPKVAKLTWTTKDDGDLHVANGARHQFRVSEGGSGGFFAQQRLAKGGKWVHVAGRADTLDQAKELAGYVEAGATWLSYQNMAGVAYAKVIESYGKGSK